MVGWRHVVPAGLAATVAWVCLGGAAAPVRADALERLERARLKAVHEAVQQLQAQRKPLEHPAPYHDYRAVVHLHSQFSHDSRGTLEEIVAAAQATGTQSLLFSEHPSDAYDPVVNGYRGTKEGVLLVPGVETGGFLLFPTESLRGLEATDPQTLADQARQRGALVFLSHLEARPDWAIRGLTGTEIYNAHADAQEETRLIGSLKNPLQALQAWELYEKYPQEAFAALADYPADYLRRWDELCQTAPHTGVAANDSHQNLGLSARLLEGRRMRWEDGSGKTLVELPLAVLPLFYPLAQGKQPGEIFWKLRLDPYPSSLRHVGTHLLARELSEAAVREALQAGRAYVAFDWIAEATGFDFAALGASGRHEMGSQVPLSRDLRLHAVAPLPVRWKLVRNGTVLAETTGETLEQPVTEAGVYRVEAWLDVAGQPQVWILSNPLYVR